VVVDGGALSTVATVVAMRGRKPTVSVLKVLRGNPGRRPLNPDEPQPHALDETCPPELGQPVEQAEWERGIVPAIRIGQITAADRTLAVAHCVQWALWQSLVAEAARHPHVIAAGKNQYPMPNPAQVLANKTLLILTGIDEKLGFSPTSRSRVVAPPRPAANAADRQRAEFLTVTRG
jgi:P27 family predicted phage terminase small subunit